MNRFTSVRAAVLALALTASAFAAGHAQDLDRSLVRVAAAWHRADAASIAALGARGGITIDIDGNPVGPLGARQATAMLRRVFEDRESVSARPNMTRDVGGSPSRAFGEVTWTARARGTTIPERATLFVAFILEEDTWRITEIRLLR